MGRSLLEGQPVGRVWAAYQLQLANDKLRSAAFLFPLAAEENLLRAFTCLQVNDFRCVRASFDAQRSLMLPVSFYGAVFYKGVQADKRAKEPRTYGKFEFDKDTVRFAEISTVNPKKQAAARASPAAGEDRLGRLGSASGLRSPGFQGFTIPAAINVATGVNRLGHNIALNQRQAQRLAMERQLAIQGTSFKAIPTDVARLTFRKDLQ